MKPKAAYQFLEEAINWYPGHMKKATTQIEEQIRRVNLFLEVVDARIPVSSHNPAIDKLIPPKVARVVVLNKSDLANRDDTDRFIKYYQAKGCKAIAINAKDQTGVSGRRLLGLLKRTGRPEFRSLGSWLMIGGIPNVGKSTIINCLRKTSRVVSGKTKAAHTGPTPGLTRGLTGFKVSLNPLMYLIDTPGIMPMKIQSKEVGYKLLICHCIKEGIIEAPYLCDYVLHCLNKHKVLDYMKHYEVPKYTENVEDVFEAIKNKYKRDHIDLLSTFMLGHFREGSLGRITLDDVPEI